ncbi:unnamed protein product [Ceutorhynchus assimilis]|uniref:Uncharacterized protein n=1 Tax=Ceutorhynchus assimilis TaxID=467358 RepID=A0A9N9MDQ0_9CUCU|nr:unnamed protein product [Ceutorhynchus assimilis]
MFNLNQEESLEQPKCSYHITDPRVFESLNMSFYHFRKDQCSLCLSYREGDEKKIRASRCIYCKCRREKHCVQKEGGCKEMSKNNPDLIAAAVFDMQQVLKLPKVKHRGKEKCIVLSSSLVNIYLQYSQYRQ